MKTSSFSIRKVHKDEVMTDEYVNGVQKKCEFIDLPSGRFHCRSWIALNDMGAVGSIFCFAREHGVSCQLMPNSLKSRLNARPFARHAPRPGYFGEIPGSLAGPCPVVNRVLRVRRNHHPAHRSGGSTDPPAGSATTPAAARQAATAAGSPKVSAGH